MGSKAARTVTQIAWTTTAAPGSVAQSEAAEGPMPMQDSLAAAL